MYKTAIITGASKGVGRELSNLLYERNYNLGLISRTFPGNYHINKDLSSDGKIIKFFRTDIKKSENIKSLCNDLKDVFPSIDILINNAGYNPRKTSFDSYDINEYNDIIDLNLKAPFILTHELFPTMKKQRSGHIINIVAAMAYLCKENWAPYASAKAGLLAFSKVLSKECIQYGIKVTSIIPGGINTGFRTEEKPEYMSPESVAKVILQAIEAPDDIVFHELVIKPLNEKL